MHISQPRCAAVAVTMLFGLNSCGSPDDPTEAVTQVQQPFKNQYQLQPWHEVITVQALPFLKPDVVNLLALENARFDALNLKFAPAHFDNCTFREASLQIRGYLTEAVAHAGEFPWGLSCPSFVELGCSIPLVGAEALLNFAIALHPIQDFYSHSNWAEIFGDSSLVDDTLDNFPPLFGGRPHGGAIFADDSLGSQGLKSSWIVRPPAARFYPQDVIPLACVPGRSSSACLPAIITGRTDEPAFGLAISPVATYPNACPSNVRIYHSRDLAKDRPNHRLFNVARDLATRQTTHEWCRFQNLVYEQGRTRGTAAKDIKFLCDHWVEDMDAANNACRSLPQEAKCNAASCTPKTCAQVGATCGIADDGCGGYTSDCGYCPSPETCAGSGVPNQCGCTPLTPAQVCVGGQNCGTAPDGCGALVSCGTCSPPETCGNGGQCCMPLAPAQACLGGQNCGHASDGCGGEVSCGSCTAPETCGRAGLQYQCGCTRKSCTQVGATCGKADDSCGGFTPDCGSCTAPEICGAAGTPNQCGTCPAGTVWDPATQKCGPGMVFVVRSHWNLPLNNTNTGSSLEPNVLDARSSGWYFSVNSSIGSNAISTTVDMSNDTCQRSNAVIGGATVEMYVLGPPATPYSINYHWTQNVSAVSNGRGSALVAQTVYSSFGLIVAYALPGQSAGDSSSGGDVAVGTSSSATITSGGLAYSHALSFDLSGAAQTNGSCYACGSDGCFCDCGVARTVITLDATLQ